MNPDRKRAFVRRLLRWYARHRRDLPWRRSHDPYRILVSEIMLQQTQVARVIPKYRAFLRRYPSLQALARAPVREVREAWYPLGYNIRPVRLQAIARAAVRRHRGRLPRTAAELLRFAGIGRYTAAAVMTFAYGTPAPILDTNVRRVLRRVFHRDNGVPDRVLWSLAASLLPARRGYDFNQALMDFGATVCTARAPACRTCPLRTACTTYPHPAAR
ncbi:MAG TPA: A/G-specific adenine glycosylase [bacterium]|nr:A/G-specific adenine glycosylase [bacterium]